MKMTVHREEKNTSPEQLEFEKNSIKITIGNIAHDRNSVHVMARTT